MAESEPAVYPAPVSPGLAASTSAALWISALTPLLAFVAAPFLPAPRVQEAR